MRNLNNQNKAYVFALLAVLFWSTVPTAFKLGLKYQDNYQMVTGATLVSVVVLGLTVLFQQKTGVVRKLRFKKIMFFAALGLLNPAAYYFILFKAYDLLPAQVAQPLNMTWPIVLVLISIPMLRQSISPKHFVALFISFAGVAALSFQDGNLLSEGSSIKGVLLALFTAVLWAFYWIFNMKNKTDEVVSLFIIFLFSGLYLLIIGLFRDPSFPVGKEAWLAAAYIGMFEMGFAFILWLKALQLSSTTATISNLVYIAPFLNLAFVNIFLDERIFISTIFGIILVIIGILIQNTAKKVEV